MNECISRQFRHKQSYAATVVQWHHCSSIEYNIKSNIVISYYCSSIEYDITVLLFNIYSLGPIQLTLGSYFMNVVNFTLLSSSKNDFQVNRKDSRDLFKTFGPNSDTMLMTCCCKKDDTTTIRAQVTEKSMDKCKL